MLWYSLLVWSWARCCAGHPRISRRSDFAEAVGFTAPVGGKDVPQDRAADRDGGV
jgi:hypothetical protein